MAEDLPRAPQWRTLIVVLATLAYPFVQTGYEIGSHGDLQFQNKLIAWATVTATFIAFMLVPRRLVPIPRWHIWLLSIPTIWALGRIAVGTFGTNAVASPALYVAGIASFVLCLPYAIYLIVRTANPDLQAIEQIRLWILMAACACLFATAGFVAGRWNTFFLSCELIKAERLTLPERCKGGTN
jgi:hypothetical protein